MDKLRHILRTPLHFSRANTVRAVWLLAVWVLWTPIEALGQELAFAPLGLAVGVSWLILVYLNIGRLRDFPYFTRARQTAFVLAFAFIAVAVFFVLTVPEPAWAQRAVSAHFVALGIYYLVVSFRDLTILTARILGPRWTSGQVNAVRWMGFFVIGQALINETAILLVTERSWLLVFAALPIVASVLIQVAITATHRYYEDR